MDYIEEIYDDISLSDISINLKDSAKLSGLVNDLFTIPEDKIDFTYLKNQISLIYNGFLKFKQTKFYINSQDVISAVENNGVISNELSYFEQSLSDISKLNEDYIHKLVSDASLESEYKSLNKFLFEVSHRYSLGIKNDDLEIFIFHIDDETLLENYTKSKCRNVIRLGSILERINELIVSSDYFKEIMKESDDIQLELEKEKINNKIDELSSIQQRLIEQVNKRENKLKSQDEETDKLLQLAGEKQIIDGHLKQADIERRMASVLFVSGLFFLTLASVMAIYVLSNLHNNYNDWQLHLIRILSSLIISIPGIYCIKESNSYKRDERHYRDLGLDLAAIPPYLREFDDIDKKELKMEFSRKLFAKQRNIDSNTVPIDYQKLIETIINSYASQSKNSKDIKTE
ncbi:hypothetical protein C0W35_17095 [Photobacterium kishitanii]|uniref:hypothetical protein n=1 Tax=Photobacterium kishitanii TaxID=318456 RepID=UPI000D17D3C7|nr:hypothetical protein [Photobacterium kishitanii]PSU90592.1 hypothetical protein C0W35_17095 [Photobacterium kishitanii]